MIRSSKTLTFACLILAALLAPAPSAFAQE